MLWPSENFFSTIFSKPLNIFICHLPDIAGTHTYQNVAGFYISLQKFANSFKSSKKCGFSAFFFDFINKKHGKDLSLYCPLDKAIETIRYEADRYSRINSPGLAATKLKAEIEAAFAAAPYPGDADDALVEHFCPECLETAAWFRGLKWQDWKDKPLEQFSRGREHLLRLTPPAFHYYLPLYMVQTLIDYMYADIATDEIVSVWAPSPEMTEYSQKRWRLLSAREIQAVISFLEFLKTGHDAELRPELGEAIKNARGLLK